MSAKVLKDSCSGSNIKIVCVKSRGRMSQLVRVLKRRNIPFESSSFLISVNQPMQSRCRKWSDVKDMRIDIGRRNSIESDGTLVPDSRR